MAGLSNCKGRQEEMLKAELPRLPVEEHAASS